MALFALGCPDEPFPIVAPRSLSEPPPANVAGPTGRQHRQRGYPSLAERCAFVRLSRRLERSAKQESPTPLCQMSGAWLQLGQSATAHQPFSRRRATVLEHQKIVALGHQKAGSATIPLAAPE